MRLPRPYVPWSIRRGVIERQLRTAGIEPTSAEKYTGSDERATRWMIERLFPGERVELNHDPALCNRSLVCLSGRRQGKMRVVMPPGTKVFNWSFMEFLDYDPPANDPDHLIYMMVGDHDVRTRVRGEHGQHSDLGLLRKSKRKAKKASRLKRKWPTRTLSQNVAERRANYEAMIYDVERLARKRKRKERKLKLVKLRIRVKWPKRRWPSRPSRPLRGRNDLRRR